MSESLQLLIVAIIVLFCALRAIQRFMPKSVWRLRARASFVLEREGRPAWLRSLGQRLRPPVAVSNDGCGTGCSSCGGCAVKAEPEALPLNFVSRARG